MENLLLNGEERSKTREMLFVQIKSVTAYHTSLFWRTTNYKRLALVFRIVPLLNRCVKGIHIYVDDFFGLVRHRSNRNGSNCTFVLLFHKCGRSEEAEQIFYSGA